MNSTAFPSNKQESGISRGNRIKASLNLADSSQFNREYGPYGKTGRPAGYFTYTHLGYEVRLRFNQSSYEWKATCPHFNIETTFPHQPPQDIQNLLNDWLLAHIERPLSVEAQKRMDRPAVLEIAAKHGIAPHVALDIYEERAF